MKVHPYLHFLRNYIELCGGVFSSDVFLSYVLFADLIVGFYLLCKKERETPGWTQLKLPGQAPSSRCGHTVTSGGHYVCLFQHLFALLCRDIFA